MGAVLVVFARTKAASLRLPLLEAFFRIFSPFDDLLSRGFRLKHFDLVRLLLWTRVLDCVGSETINIEGLKTVCRLHSESGTDTYLLKARQHL